MPALASLVVGISDGVSFTLLAGRAILFLLRDDMALATLGISGGDFFTLHPKSVWLALLGGNRGGIGIVLLDALATKFGGLRVLLG